jgi:hypothetical protein
MSMRKGRLELTLLVICSIIITAILSFPQIPLQIRYVIPVSLMVLALCPSILKEKIWQWMAIYTAYVTTLGIGIIATQGDGNGTINNALWGIRSLGFCTIICGFIQVAKPKHYLMVFATTLVISSIGIVLDVVAGPAHNWIPFPIMDMDKYSYAGNKSVTSDRYGGFTYESGVLGGETSVIFAISLLASIGLTLRSKTSNFFKLPVSIFFPSLIITGLYPIIVLLAKTKSSIAILAGSILAIGVSYLFIKRGSLKKSQVLVLSVISLFLLSIPLAIVALEKTTYGDYVREEIQNAEIVANIQQVQSVDKFAGGGLASRYEYLQLAIKSLPTSPFGGGYSNGQYFTRNGRGQIQPTPEMVQFWKNEMFNGYKSFLLNMLSQGGIISIIFLILLLRELSKQPPYLQFYAPGLVGAFLVLGATVELVPYIELIFLAIGFKKSILKGK